MDDQALHRRYVELVNLLRLRRGLRPLPNIVPVDNPAPLIEQMEAELRG